MLYDMLMLAQAGGQGAAQPQGDPNALIRLLFPIFAVGLLFYFMLLRPQKRREQEFRRLVENLKENDRVVTVGGIHGVVTNVQRDADRLTVRIDEATGTKIKVGLSAVARVVTDEGTDSAKAEEKKS